MRKRSTLVATIIAVIVGAVAIVSQSEKPDREGPKVGDASPVVFGSDSVQHDRAAGVAKHTHSSLLDRLGFEPPDENEPPPSAVKSTRITGRVIDADTRLPVPGAHVRLNMFSRTAQHDTTEIGAERTTRADSEGRFSVPTRQGTYAVLAYCNALEPHRYGVAEAIGLRWNETAEVVVEIGGKTTVRGHVLDGEGRGVAGLRLIITPSFTNSDPMYLRLSANDGSFAVSGMSGPKSSVTIMSGYAGMTVEPKRSIIQESERPFEFKMFKAKAPNEPRSPQVHFDYEGEPIPGSVRIRYLQSSQLVSSDSFFKLHVGRNRIGKAPLDTAKGLIEIEIEHPERGLIVAPLEERDEGLWGRGSGWTKGMTMTGVVRGVRSKDARVLVYTKDDAGAIPFRESSILPDGTFSLKNLPDRSDLFFAVFDRDYVVLNPGKYTRPLGPIIDGLVVELPDR